MKDRALEAYMREVRRHPRLSPTERDWLAQAYGRTRDPKLAGRLILSHLRLVVRIANECSRSGHRLPDLVQEGNLGLLEAVQRFDPSRGVKLSTYAAWWIRAYMLKFLIGDARLVKVGTTPAQRRLFFGLSRVQQKLEAAGLVPTGELLAEQLAVTAPVIEEMQARLQVGAETSIEAWQETLPGAAPPADELAEARQLRERLQGKLQAFGETLQGREEVLFRDRLLSESPAPLREIGARFGLSGERARQIEALLLRRLRVFLAEEYCDAAA